MEFKQLFSEISGIFFIQINIPVVSKFYCPLYHPIIDINKVIKSKRLHSLNHKIYMSGLDNYKVYSILINLKYMSSRREQILEEKLRKSESLTEKDIYLDFMMYAKDVSDEMDVYLYMQENKIGINQAKYWVARMQIMRRRCQFVQLVKLVKEVKNMPELEQKWEIVKYEQTLISHLKNVYHSQFKGKRKVEQFSKTISNIHPQKRKIGNFQVYIDQQCRNNYDAEDYSRYIETKMNDFCEVQKQEYKRIQDRKPPSFLAKKQEYFIELTKQVFSKTTRQSVNNRQSIGTSRFSNKLNTLNTQFEVDFATPKVCQNLSPLQKSIKKSRSFEKRMKDSSRDSIQILKSMQKQRLQHLPESPKFRGESHIQQQLVERCRSTSNIQPFDYLGFSFGKKKNSSQKKQRKVFQKQLYNRDDAFIFNSFSQQSKFTQKINLNFLKKEDFQLELIIKEIQRQTYEDIEFKTFSEIGSNQQNQNYEVNNHSFHLAREARKPFEDLLQIEGQLFEIDNAIKFEQLVDFDQEESNPEKYNRLQMQNYTNEIYFLSQNKKRLSNISEQISNYHTESKHKQRTSK